MKYLGLADDNSKFPKSINAVYEELISLEEVEAQIRSDSKRGNRDTGSVHMITGASKLEHNLKRVSLNPCKQQNKCYQHILPSTKV